MKPFLLTAVVAAFVVAAAWMGSADVEAEDQQRALYCDMVELHEQTNGRDGWPAYDGQCH